MNRTELRRRVLREAADHLYSLEIYDEFSGERHDQIDEDIQAIQILLRRKAKSRRPRIL